MLLTEKSSSRHGTIIIIASRHVRGLRIELRAAITIPVLLAAPPVLQPCPGAEKRTAVDTPRTAQHITHYERTCRCKPQLRSASGAQVVSSQL
eukprot:1432815-Pleurochrysis_carterae.AAC.3